MKQRKDSGQILLIAAFIMASLLLSAQIYVFEVGRIQSEIESDSLNDFMLSVQLGSAHVVTGSLANISNGGSSNTLESNLQKWVSFMGNQYLHGKSALDYTLRDAAPFSSGIWLNWGVNGFGVSSAYVNFTHRLLGRNTNVDQAFFVNTTTALLMESTNRRLSGDTRQVNVTISLWNEKEPALARQITVYYKASTNWLIPDETNNYTLQDYGNGTYKASFVATFLDESVEVSARILDYRDIHVQANATSTEV